MPGFSSILKSLREADGLTQEELATKLGISRSRLASYEQGTREPTLEILESMADFFNVDLDYLIGRSTTTTKIDLHNSTKTNNYISTIAAHMDGVSPTEDELKQITEYIDFVFRDAFKKKK